MADNIAVTPGSGATVAADDISGVLYQRVKVTFGVDGSASDVNSGSPLPSVDAAVAALIGEVQASPTANTLLDRLKTLATALAGTLTVDGSGATQPVSAASLPLPTGAATQTTLAALDAKVTACDTGDVAITTALPSGTNVIGSVKIDQTSPGTSNKVAASTNARRGGAATIRSSVTAVDKMSNPSTPTGTGATVTSGSLVPATTYAIAVVARNAEGVTLATVSANIVPGGSNNAIRATIAQVAGATDYALFCGTSVANGLPWVGTLTETLRASGTGVITTVGTTNSTGSAGAGQVDIGVVGTGITHLNAAFAFSTAYTTTTPVATAIPCAGYSKLHLFVSLTLTDWRTAPALTLLPYFQNASDSAYYAGTPIPVFAGGATGAALHQEFVIDVDGCANVAVLIDTLAGQGASVTILGEPA